jgi:hypothetical protein
MEQQSEGSRRHLLSIFSSSLAEFASAPFAFFYAYVYDYPFIDFRLYEMAN